MGLTTRISDCAGGHIALTHYGPGEVCRAHRHPGAQISLILSGDYREDGSAGPVKAREGMLTCKPPGFEHENVFGDLGALILTINLGEAPFLKAYVAGDPPFGTRDVLLTTAAAGQLSRLIPSDRALPDAVRSVVARRSWLDQAHASLRAGDESCSRRLAQSAGVHPVTFARLFRDAFGRSPGLVRQSSRNSRALQFIVRSRSSLIEVALESGFADQAHMTRTIRQATGYPPARLRRMFTAA